MARSRRKRQIAPLSCAVLLVTVVTACGGGSSNNASSAASTPSSSAAAPSTSTSGTQAPSGALVSEGKSLYTSLGCNSCHSLNGKKGIGPTWKGLAGSSVPLTNGKTVTANDSYLAKKIANANATTVKGYDPGVMASTVKPGSVSAKDTKALVAYIDSLK